MRLCSVAVGALVCMMNSAAYADTWVAHQKFVSGMQSCANARTVDYTYSFDGKTLVVTNENGRMTTVSVPADGMVNQDFKSPSGNALNVSGNVLTKELVITNTRNNCKWATLPKK